MKVQYWWFSQPRAAPWTAPKCLDPSHRAKQNNKQTNEEGQEEGWGNLVLYQWSAGPRNHMGGSKSCQFTWGEFTPHTNTHILQKHTKKKNTTTNQATTVSQSAVCELRNQMGARGTEGSPAEMPNLLYTCKWSQIYCTSYEESCDDVGVFSDLQKYLVWHGEGAYLRRNIFGLLQEEKEKEENMLET